MRNKCTFNWVANRNRMFTRKLIDRFNEIIENSIKNNAKKKAKSNRITDKLIKSMDTKNIPHTAMRSKP